MSDPCVAAIWFEIPTKCCRPNIAFLDLVFLPTQGHLDNHVQKHALLLCFP
ncbi:MAG TPA: hypothetical protein VNX18_05515 [Bryobacteraceae bacterium]|nr:hypothetical protein [Bryobacteraceae bacterium]